MFRYEDICLRKIAVIRLVFEDSLVYSNLTEAVYGIETYRLTRY